MLSGKRLLFTIVMGALLLAAPASADTVQELLERCKKSAGFDRGVCMGYIAAIGETYKSICGNATYGAWTRAFILWADNHPERWNEPSPLGVITALQEKWPCKN